MTFESDAVVETRVPPADGVVALTLAAADGRDLPARRPGAHTDLLFGDGMARRYSLCGDPAGGRRRVAVKREGPGSPFLHDRARAGDRVRVRGPRATSPHLPLDL